MKSIAVGKIGKSVLFNSSQWGAIGGDNEAPIFYENLFHKNPDITFYIIGASDYSRIDKSERDRINQHGNVIDVWSNFTEWGKSYRGESKTKRQDYLTEWMLTSPKIDVALLFLGPTGTSNVVGKSRLMTDPTSLASPIEMLAKYSGPIIDYLNMNREMPWVGILNDPRFFPANMRDMFHRPSLMLSQYTESIKHTTVTEYDNPKPQTVTVQSNYTAIETIFLIGKEKGKAIVEAPTASLDSFFEDTVELKEGEKDIKFMIVCNEGRPSRYSDLKKYILDHVEDVDIYGKWVDEILNNDKRFKGPKNFNDLQQMLPRVKYTFCIPIKKGWVTAKFWEMAHYGIIPFLHPTYDEQNNLKCPEFLRVTDSKDLYKKIEFLEKNPDAYDTLRSNIESMLKNEYYDGTYLNNLTIQTLKETLK
jgi:hypothetical protein